jgi:hypothetical protein
MDTTTYYARRLAAEMFFDMEAPDPLLDFKALYRQRTGREPNDQELEAAGEVFKIRDYGVVDPPPSASGLAYKIPALVRFDPYGADDA